MISSHRDTEGRSDSTYLHTVHTVVNTTCCTEWIETRWAESAISSVRRMPSPPKLTGRVVWRQVFASISVLEMADELTRMDLLNTSRRSDPSGFQKNILFYQLSVWYRYLAEFLLYFVSRDSLGETSRSEHKYSITMNIFTHAAAAADFVSLLISA